MTFKDSLAAIKRNWRLTTLISAIGLLAGVIYALAVPSTYTSSLDLYVAAQNSDSANAAYQGTLLSQQRVKSYTELVGSPKVVTAVKQELALPLSQADIARKITASSAPDSILITLSASDSNPKIAADIANSASIAFIALVNDLERPQSPGSTPAVAVRMVAPAEIPLAPTSLGLASLAMVGLLLGAAVGTAAAIALATLSTRINSREELRAVTRGLPLLGGIPDDLTSSRATRAPDEGHAWRESFRQVRTNIQFTNIDRLNCVLVVTSALPGEGKTTFSVGLARALAAAGQRVLLIDGDLRRPNVAERLQLEGRVGLSTVLAGRIDVHAAVQRVSTETNLWALAAGVIPPNPSELLASQQMQALLREMGNEYDTILVDTPPLLPVTDAAALAPNADGVIYVCDVTSARRQNVTAALDALLGVSAKIIGAVSMRAPWSEVPAGRYYGYKTSQDNGKVISPEVDGGLTIPASYEIPNRAPVDRPVPHRRS